VKTKTCSRECREIRFAAREREKIKKKLVVDPRDPEESWTGTRNRKRGRKGASPKEGSPDVRGKGKEGKSAMANVEKGGGHDNKRTTACRGKERRELLGEQKERTLGNQSGMRQALPGGSRFRENLKHEQKVSPTED